MNKKIQEQVFGEAKEVMENYLDKYFPKGKCKERGKALVIHAIAVTKLEESISKIIKLMEEEFRKLHQGLYNTNVMLTKKVKKQKADFKKMIEDFEIMTDIEEGDEPINKKELLAKLGDDEVVK